MKVDVGLDSVPPSHNETMELIAHATDLGYGRVWCGSSGDPFQTCAVRWTASIVDGRSGIGTATGIMPISYSTPADLAARAIALNQLTSGRFTLGLGVGGAYESSYRHRWGITENSALMLMRRFLTTIRDFCEGRPVNAHEFGYHQARLPFPPMPTPLYVGANGPNMTTLGGELADGIYLSWCTPESIRSTRANLLVGAAQGCRDPSKIDLAASVRVSIDRNVETARRALAAALLPYVIGWSGRPSPAYRTALQRMGFYDEITLIDDMRERGLSNDEIVEHFPESMLSSVGYYGPPEGAPDRIRHQAGVADTAVIRIVKTSDDTSSILGALEACQPANF